MECATQIYRFTWDTVLQKATNSYGGSKRRLKYGSGPQRLLTGTREHTNYPIPGTQYCRGGPYRPTDHLMAGGATNTPQRTPEDPPPTPRPTPGDTVTPLTIVG